MRAEPKPGEVYFVDLGMAAKARYVLILAADDSVPLALVSGLAITTKFHHSQYEITLPRVPFLREQSYANAQSLQPFKVIELGRLAGRFENAVVEKARQAVANWLRL